MVAVVLSGTSTLIALTCIETLGMPLHEQSVAAPATEAGFAAAFLIREVERRLLDLFAEGRLFGTVHTCIGQEWVGVAIAAALRQGDMVVSNHRCHGHFIARTGDVEGLIAEIMGKETGACGGRGGSQHLCSIEHGFFSNGIQGGMMPIAAGFALAHKLRGSDGIAVIFIGDGTLGEGLVYETFNIASKWDVPLLIVLENNRYAQSTPQSATLAGDIQARAAAFGIHTYQADTWDPNTLCSVAEECVREVRRGHRPVFLQVDCDRLMAHSKGDDSRDPEDIRSMWSRDALTAFLQQCPREGAALQERARHIVDAAVREASAAPYMRPPQLENLCSTRQESAWQASSPPSEERFAARICDSLRRNMQRDPRIFVLGEDVESPYGGAFKVTKALSDDFPDRVCNTPISEAAIVGIGSGLAMCGHCPVCEIMFGDFLTLAADQLINHASKFREMYNGMVEVPLIVRTPMGGRRGYGPTHSQSLEKHFLGIPQTQVLALHHRYDPGLVYDQLFASIDRPTIVIENKQMYSLFLGAQGPAGFALECTDEPYPTTRLRPSAPPSITIFCYGGMLPHVEQAVMAAFDEDETVVEVIAPIRIYPLNPWPVIESVRKTGVLLIVEEGIGFAALGSELIARIAELAPDIMHRTMRVSAPAVPIPSCGPMVGEVLPNATMILTSLRELSRHD
jgi:2-oxoisovalerate dehydrogenase E1 component